MEALYNKKILEAQERSKGIYDAWHKLEIEFNLLKVEGFKDKFQKAVLQQKRKMFRLEYASVLNTVSVLLIGIKRGNYIQG